MSTKILHCIAGLACLLCLAGTPAFCANLDSFSDALENLADMTRSADRMYDSLQDAMRNDRDYSRYERDWRNSESRLERERLSLLAHIAGVSEARLRSLRNDGYGWGEIARKYGIDPNKIGYGASRYDHQRDSWKGVPPGLAKKGGMPPGQAKKMDGSDKHGKGNKQKK